MKTVPAVYNISNPTTKVQVISTI